MLRLAISPCPNDTFIFHALLQGKIPNAPACTVTWADIEQTNTWIAHPDAPYDVLKFSYGALPQMASTYGLLPCGGAVGYGCGPLVVCRTGTPHDWRRIAVPDANATACVLLRLWLASIEAPPSIERIVLPFSEIMPAVARGDVEAGLIIHEARFLYPSYALTLTVDLGAWWEQRTGEPIALGVIAVRRSLHAANIAQWIRQSLQRASFADTLPFVRAHAQHPEEATLRAHIALYVNDFTTNLGTVGKSAVRRFCHEATQAGIFPQRNWMELFLPLEEPLNTP